MMVPASLVQDMRKRIAMQLLIQEQLRAQRQAKVAGAARLMAIQQAQQQQQVDPQVALAQQQRQQDLDDQQEQLDLGQKVGA